MHGQVFLNDFLADRLDPVAFDHQAHVRAAWLLLSSRSFETALLDYIEAIKKLAYRAGAPDKLHYTITAALMSLIASSQAENPVQSWDEFLARGGPLITDAFGLLQKHYSRELLYSERAKTSWLKPDRLPLPARTAQINDRQKQSDKLSPVEIATMVPSAVAKR